MSDTDTKRGRIKAKVAASQERLKRETEGTALVPRRVNLPDAYPPEDYRGLAAEYPLLTVATGLGLGLLVGALLPKRFGGRIGKRALTLATMAGELGLALSRQAGAAALDAGQEGLTKAASASAPLRRRAVRIAGSAGGNARTVGLAVAREAVKLAIRARKGA